MIYEILMPQLSDSMDEGKLIAWKVSAGDSVKNGDVIAEVESDKAIMELQTFKDGRVTKLLLKEGESAEVGAVIARIDTDGNASTQRIKKAISIAPIKEIENENTAPQVSVEHLSKESVQGISPKARAKIVEYGLNANELMRKTQKKAIYAADVQHYLYERYFTPKALRLLHKYNIKASCFELHHKIDEAEIKAYIEKYELPLLQPLSAMQKAIVANVEASVKKPIFHIVDSLDAGLLQQHRQYSITVWLLKIFAKVMMKHEAFRTVLDHESLHIFANASISLAVGDKKDLYMPVLKNVNSLQTDEIAKHLEAFKVKRQHRRFTVNDMQGATFGMSNLGMLGIERFDAMINKNESAIVAIGTIVNGKIAITLTVDHRVINGYEAALFVNDAKREVQNPLNFKD